MAIHTPDSSSSSTQTHEHTHEHTPVHVPLPVHGSAPQQLLQEQQQQLQQQQQQQLQRQRPPLQQLARCKQTTLASVLKQAPPPYPEVHHAPIAGLPPFPSCPSTSSPSSSASSSSSFLSSSASSAASASSTSSLSSSSSSSSSASLSSSLAVLVNTEFEGDAETAVALSAHTSPSPTSTFGATLSALPIPPIPINMGPVLTAQTITPPAPSALLSSLPPARNSLPQRSDKDYSIASPTSHLAARPPPNFPRAAPFPLQPQPPPPSQQAADEAPYSNPYRAPSQSNSCAFVPPKVRGYEFAAGSQAGNMGLVIGTRIADGMPVTGKLHQSRVLLQHEHRILKRLQIVDGRFDPHGTPPPQFAPPSTLSEEAKADVESLDDSAGKIKSGCHHTPGLQQAVYEMGWVEGEKYFNRIVEGFMDLDRAEMSILIMRRLGPNLLSPHHHRFAGLDDTDGHQSPHIPAARQPVSPFPDVYTFLIFCLKVACVLEALQKANLAHLALCPTAFHWAPPASDVVLPDATSDGPEQHQQPQQTHQRNPTSLYHEPEITATNTTACPNQPTRATHGLSDATVSPRWDVNDTKLRLFDFTHSKILSHERARAPNNIFEWQIPGYMEYHLQYLAPEQTGRAETWMDHRTDIYGLGATLFTLLTLQFPNPGNDSVQILQGVLSRSLPPLRTFRPDMPPIIDDILRKMTQKQPSQRYQNAFGFKQDILRCLNQLYKSGTIESFPLGKHDISYQFIIPNAVFGRQVEQQLISAAISQAATAYQQALNSGVAEGSPLEEDLVAPSATVINDSDHYIFEDDDIVSLQSQSTAKIPLSSKTLLRTPKPFDGGKSVHRESEMTDPVVRAIFVSGPSGVGKSVLIRGMAQVARNSGLFAGGIFEAEGNEPYSAILSCIQSVLQQLLTQHTDALASLVIAIRTAFEPSSGIGIICDLVPELKYFFDGTENLESKDVSLTNSAARFHALILKLIRVISTHFFMTWLIDDIHYADENSIALLSTLVNVNKRLPIVLIMTHRDTVDCLMKVKQILGGNNTRHSHVGSHGSLGDFHHDALVDGISHLKGPSIGSTPMSKTTAIRATGLPLVVRGGGGVRFIRLQNPEMETIQEFLGVLLHRQKPDVLPLATVLHSKSWLTIRQLVLELYRNQTIFFNCFSRVWEWESCPETLAEVVRKLTGEEYAFLENRFRELDCATKKTIICAAICGSIFTIQDIQLLASTAYVWTGQGSNHHAQVDRRDHAPGAATEVDSNKGSTAMAGLQSALREGILVYTSTPDNLRFHHGIMRKVALNLLKGTDEKERLHYEMAKILFRRPGQEFRTASHILQCMDLVRKKLASGGCEDQEEKPFWVPVLDEDDEERHPELDEQSVRMILSLAGEKSQKSGAQDMSMSYWSAALSLLPKDCWTLPGTDASGDMTMESPETRKPGDPEEEAVPEKTPLYLEALRIHLQCIEAERWRENFDQAMKICEEVLSNITDLIDRARVYQHQIEMSVWAYSNPAQATRITIQCLQELGMSKEVSFNPSQEEIRDIYDRTHLMLLDHMKELEVKNPKMCRNARISTMMEVLNIANATLYYQNIPFLAVGIAQSMKLVCEHGISKDAGRALVSFALTHSTWHGCLENAYELGRLACRVSNDNHHVKFLFYLTVQQWGDHIANSIPALEETLMAAEMTCDRLFHTAGMIHVSVMRVLLGRTHLRDCMNATIDLITKHIEFGPKSHGVEVMQGIAQLIKCLKGQTLADSPETIFDDNEYAQARIHGRRQEKNLVMVHNNSTYSMLKIVAAFVFGHYAFINEVTDTWHDDPKSMMNFEGSWISHSIFTVVGLALVNLLRTEHNPVEREKLSSRLRVVRNRMDERAKHFPTNHAAMFHLLEAEIADQAWEQQKTCLGKVMLLYERAIFYATEGNFPLHKCFSYELAARCHLRHGLVTSAKCLMTAACKGYQDWGARGKVQWLHKTYPEIFGSAPELEPVHSSRGLFYRPNDAEPYTTGHPVGPTGAASSNLSSTVAGSSSSGHSTSPWLAASPKTMYSPGGFGNDAVSAAAAAIAESCMSTHLPGSGNVGSSASSSGPLHNLQNTWAASPGSPEVDNADLDVLDFSSVIESMQVIASEIDLDLLLVKSLYVLNQSVGAKQCSIFISKNHELVLAASQGNLGRCESVNPPQPVGQCSSLFHGVINYVRNTSTLCLLTNAMDDPRFCADDYLKQRADLRTVLCAPILHKTVMVGVLYMEDFPERAFANKRMLVMNLLVQQLGISITNALLYQSVLQSETKLNGLLENMPCGIALWDATAENCQYINSSWKDMTGFSLEEIMSSGWEILTHEDELAIYADHWRERVLAGVPCQWESRYRLKDGSFRWAIIRMLPIKSPSDNRVIQWLTVTIDIDDQRRAVQLKSNFLANMSHELRTPFSGILGMLSLLRDSSGLSHEQFEFVDMAKASCEMLIRIVDDLLNFSKLEADKVTLEYIPLCFEEIVGDVCDLLVPLASRKGLELIILFDPTLPLDLIGDPDRLKQILMNLIGNAIKFSASGNVVIEFWHERNKRETLKRPSKKPRSTQSLLRILSGKAHKKDTEVVAEMDDPQLGDEIVLHCSVSDQGIGLSPEEQKMLFVSFQQTDNGTTRKYGGTGLGLSICAQLIAHMHGKVTVDSEKGQGATFTFTAKLRTSTPHDHEQSPAESARLLECYRILDARLDVIRGRRFLILSPNRQLREQITRTLQGAICVEFDDMASALESGTIKMTGTCTTETADGTATARNISLEATSGSSEELKERNGTGCGTRDAKCCSIEGMTRFDYILVDHVLDSAELDRIYPSPTVAFILLLAPTTETLRWILPPAVKSQPEEHEEPESGQIDIGGRGRIFQQASEIGLEAHAVGQIQRASHETSAQQNQAALASLAGRATAVAAAVKIAAAKTKVPVSPCVKQPSELFKKRKSRGQITVTRPVPCTITGGNSESEVDLQQKGQRHEAVCRPRMETTSFQIFRLIKPVRRMKILQIIYNAMNRHMQPQRAEVLEEDAEMEAKDMDMSEADEANAGQDTESEVFSTSSCCSADSSVPMKRRREQGPLDDREDDGEENRRVKVSKDSTVPHFETHLVGVHEVSRNLGLSGAGISAGTPRKARQETMPKRARNNDALTSLLSSAERNSCRGKNVLVAEDDFVSQRLLEKQLSKLGMNVMIANNGQEAVNQWLSADRGHYTIAIFDHHMPIMDGLAATKKVRALEAEFAQEHKDEAGRNMRIPIVGLSADIQQTTKESCIKAGMDEYMTKPLLTKGLALLIQRYCCN
ncbi:unnamed protein product [Mortierella alpina]